MSRSHPATRVSAAERAVIRAAMGLMDKNGFAFQMATSESVKTYYINEKKHRRLEIACWELKEARRGK